MLVDDEETASFNPHSHVGSDKSAMWYWQTHGLNQLADRDDDRAITKRINGGTNGLDDRRKYLARAKRVFNI